MAQAAIPILVGTGVQILGAEMGWDPRLTALASMAAGGIGAGMTTGAFGGAAAQAAIAPTATGAVWNPATVGQGLASSAIPSAASSAIPSAASFAVPGGEAGRVLGGMNYTQNMSPAYSAVAEVKAPMPGKVVKLLVSAGDVVEAGQGILLFEAMKMQNEIRSPMAGTVVDFTVQEGQAVDSRGILFSVKGE